MIKPRCGFYITEKFPKIPKYLPDGDWEVSIPDGAVVIYDITPLLIPAMKNSLDTAKNL